MASLPPGIRIVPFRRTIPAIDAGLQLQFPQGGIRQRHALVHMEFQRFHRAAHQPVQGLDPGTGGAFHGPDILDNQFRGHIPHGHHAVDHSLAADQFRQRAAVDLGHHLALLRLAGGAHGHEDVGLVDAVRATKASVCSMPSSASSSLSVPSPWITSARGSSSLI